MPWEEISQLDERIRFIKNVETGMFTITELCENFGVSRVTGHKWIRRFHEGGYDNLHDQSCAPHSCSHRTSKSVSDMILAEKKKHKTFGPRKLLAVIERAGLLPDTRLCSVSTASAILDKAGLVSHRSRRKRSAHPGSSPLKAEAPNDVWFADYKGDFLTGDAKTCYPLTISDAHSRRLMACKGQLTTAHVGAKSVFMDLFGEVGLPVVIRTDNGGPFCSNGICGLSRLSILWMKLGIIHHRIDRGKPTQNSIHERMHRELKKAVCRPPSANLAKQQIRFDDFRKEFNEERPHEGLDMRTPSDVWVRSDRKLPAEIPSFEYPGHMMVRSVRSNGCIKFKGSMVFISEVLTRERVALEETDDGIWSIKFMDKLIGKMHDKDKKVVATHG